MTADHPGATDPSRPTGPSADPFDATGPSAAADPSSSTDPSAAADPFGAAVSGSAGPDTAGLAPVLATVAGVARLLVACDYDGTLAPIVAVPSEAYPQPGATEALARLAALPGTTVVLVSGRTVADLAALAGPPPGVHLVGSHGAEFDEGVIEALDADAAALHDRLVAALKPVAAEHPGVRLEVKPASVAVHTRTAARPDAAAAAGAVRSGPATWPGVRVTEGKEVVELSVVTSTKGTALDALRARYRADAVAYLGDDTTDEDAFATLRPTDLGIKIGPGPTAAPHRIPDPAAAVDLLRHVAALRHAHS